METMATKFAEICNSIATSFSTTNFQLALLIGSGLLAICLLVLALTRWGQSRPIWKCVILSFGAHILLLGYAYGTHLMFESPEVVAELPDPMRVNLVEEVGSSVIQDDSIDATPQDWDQFVSPTMLPNLLPSPDQLSRPEIDSQVVIERDFTPDVIQPAIKPDAEISIPDATQDFLPTQPDVSSTDFASIEVDSKDVNIEPPKIHVERRIEEQPQTELPPIDAPTDIQRQEIVNDFQPNDFQPTPAIDVANGKTENEDTIQDAIDDPTSFVSELVDQDAQLKLADQNLPSPAPVPAANEFKRLKPMSAPNRMRLVNSTRRLGDGQPLPKAYSLRSPYNRLEVAQKRGGSIETEQAVNAALRWLADNQQEDGRWDSGNSGGGNEAHTFGHDRKGAGADADCGITGLATLSFLAAGHTHLEGPYQQEIQKALEFLGRQQKLDGSLSGDARLFAKMYCHSMSLLALSEALAMTGDRRLITIVQKGVDYSVNSQSRQDGGWRYQPGDEGDMSQFGWQVLALNSAEQGGAVVPRKTITKMEDFLKRCSTGVGGGLASYRPKQGPSTAMTAEALTCRYFLKQDVSQQTLIEASRQIATEYPTPHHVNLYYWYYGTLAMYHAGGADWDRWNEELKKTLLPLQERNGVNAGSYSPNGVWGGYGGRVYSTAMATLNLEVYYRYLPSFESNDRSAAINRQNIR